MSAADVSLGSARRGRTLSLGRVLWWLALLTVIAGAGRIVATYDVFGVTFDEPAHIAAGMQLLDRDKFTYEPLHPPLARIAVGLGPYLAGYRAQDGGDMWIEGRRLFYTATSGPDRRLLTLARLGVVPFFVLTLVIVWVWGARQYGAAAGALAVILLGNLPLLLGHAGLATTDVVFSAMFLLAFCAFVEWVETPSAVRGLALGMAVALAVTAKLSALLFLPAACVTVLLYRWVAERSWSPIRLFRAWPSLLAPAAAFLLVVWAVYGCERDPFYGIKSLAEGIAQLTDLARAGDYSYFLGEIRAHGSWAFFPVLILVKSPLPFLLAFAIGAAGLLHRDRGDWRCMAALLGVVAIVASVVPSTINIGLRHILPAFPLMAIVAAVGLARPFAAPVAGWRFALGCCSPGRWAMWPRPLLTTSPTSTNSCAASHSGSWSARISIGVRMLGGFRRRCTSVRCRVSISPSIPAPICASTTCRPLKPCIRASRPPAGLRLASRCKPSIVPGINGSAPINRSLGSARRSDSTTFPGRRPNQVSRI